MAPDDRTRSMRPADPAGPPPPGRDVYTETEYGQDPFRAEVLDRLSSLRSALAFVGVLAAAALGVAVWALLADDEGGGEGVSASRVSGIEDRLDELENRIADRATENQLGEVADAQQELADRVEAVEQAVEDGGGDEQATQQLQESIDALGERIDELEQRVEDAEAQAPEQPQP